MRPYGSAATRHGLITSPRFAAECDVVHAALRGGASSESFQYNVDDSLGGEDVSADHCRVIARIKDRSLRDDDVDRS